MLNTGTSEFHSLSICITDILIELYLSELRIHKNKNHLSEFFIKIHGMPFIRIHKNKNHLSELLARFEDQPIATESHNQKSVNAPFDQYI